MQFLCMVQTPSDAKLGDRTGVSATPAEQAVAAGSGPSGDPPNVPYSGVQLTADGVWGAWLNTTATTEHLTTTTLESTFGSETSPCVDVWDAEGGGEFRVQFDLAVPTAFKLNASDNGCAVYVSHQCLGLVRQQHTVHCLSGEQHTVHCRAGEQHKDQLHVRP
jgi:hypothetical protein